MTQINPTVAVLPPATASQDGYLQATDFVTFSGKADAADIVDLQGQIDTIELTPGPAGTNGNTWTSGTGVPSNGSGVNGDLYLRTITGSSANGDVYLKTAGVWNIITNIRGAEGPQGPQGEQGIQGEQGPIGDSGPAGATGTPGSDANFPSGASGDILYHDGSNPVFGSATTAGVLPLGGGTLGGTLTATGGSGIYTHQINGSGGSLTIDAIYNTTVSGNLSVSGATGLYVTNNIQTSGLTASGAISGASGFFGYVENSGQINSASLGGYSGGPVTTTSPLAIGTPTGESPITLNPDQLNFYVAGGSGEVYLNIQYKDSGNVLYQTTLTLPLY